MQKRVKISWDDAAQTIVRYDFDYGWTWAELDEANAALRDLIQAASREVCTMAIQNYPQHYLPAHPLSKISAMLPQRLPQVGLTVIVSHSSLVTSIMQLIVKLYPGAGHLRFANTVDEARAMIRLYSIQKDY